MTARAGYSPGSADRSRLRPTGGPVRTRKLGHPVGERRGAHARLQPVLGLADDLLHAARLRTTSRPPPRSGSEAIRPGRSRRRTAADVLVETSVREPRSPRFLRNIWLIRPSQRVADLGAFVAQPYLLARASCLQQLAVDRDATSRRARRFPAQRRRAGPLPSCRPQTRSDETLGQLDAQSRQLPTRRFALRQRFRCTLSHTASRRRSTPAKGLDLRTSQQAARSSRPRPSLSQPSADGGSSGPRPGARPTPARRRGRRCGRDHTRRRSGIRSAGVFTDHRVREGRGRAPSRRRHPSC